jgi:hypothetical protein
MTQNKTLLNISERTLCELGKIITGDGEISPYKSGPKLVKLFNEFGLNDVYESGFPSRWEYAEDSIRKLNGKFELIKIIERVVDPREFLGTNYDIDVVIKHFNEYLIYEKHKLEIVDGYVKVRDLHGPSIVVSHPFQDSQEDTYLLIEEHIKKCNSKIEQGDYSGSITNARSLLENVLTRVEEISNTNAPKYDGDLVKLYKRVSKLLDLSPGRKDISDTLKQVLRGLNSIVAGLSSARNKMSDAHVSSYKPAKHHAKLAVKAAKTITEFLFETKQFKQLIKK